MKISYMKKELSHLLNQSMEESGQKLSQGRISEQLLSLSQGNIFGRFSMTTGAHVTIYEALKTTVEFIGHLENVWEQEYNFHQQFLDLQEATNRKTTFPAPKARNLVEFINSYTGHNFKLSPNNTKI